MEPSTLSDNQTAFGDFMYRTFHENLQQRMSVRELQSLQILGEDFFTLVDLFANDLFESHGGDCLLLELSMEEFLWELQIFLNQFLRNCCENTLRLKSFCKNLKQNIEAEPFRKQFMQVLDDAYQQHFYAIKAKDSYLI